MAIQRGTTWNTHALEHRGVHWDLPAAEKVDDDKSIFSLAEQIVSCVACSARQEAMHPVPGIGNKTGIVFVGRNPGRDEDKAGSPFTGPSGRILDDFLKICGLTRDDIFLTNTILCYTTNDRMPKKDEIKTCVNLHLKPYLEILQPYLLVTLGKEAMNTALGHSRIGEAHGKLFIHRQGFYIIPAYHPGAMLYNPRMKIEIEYDAVQIRRFLDRRAIYLERLVKRRNAQDLDA